MDQLHEKYSRLLAQLRELGSLAVAFSGGVDSGFLLAAAREALGEKAAALTAVSRAFPGYERQEAEELCRSLGVKQTAVAFDPLAVEGFRENPKNRCYLCKRALFAKLLDAARGQGFAALAEGSNTDDEGDYRPGLAAIRELGVLSPLRQAGLSKAEIRALSKELGLPTWGKPSFACLATRIAYGEAITEEKLAMVERAEELLRAAGFSQFRVRVHGSLARIELYPKQFPLLMAEDLRRRVSGALKDLGFAYVTLDLDGFRSGSMNEVLPELSQSSR